MLLRSLAVFAGGKHLQTNTLDRASQVVNELALNLKSQDFALSFKENGKIFNRMASLETPFIWMASHFSKNDKYAYWGSLSVTLQIALVEKE